MNERICETCGGPLPPPKRASGRRRRFCSERCRKAQYAVPCTDCGGPVDGTTPSMLSATPRCVPCRRKWQHDSRRWTPERVLAAIREFEAAFGRAPGANDFNASIRRVDPDTARFPPVSAVLREFGTWNAAIRAAGFEPFDHARDHTWGPGRPLHEKQAA